MFLCQGARQRTVASPGLHCFIPPQAACLQQQPLQGLGLHAGGDVVVRPRDVASLPWMEVKQLWFESMALLSEALAEAAGDAASPAHPRGRAPPGGDPAGALHTKPMFMSWQGLSQPITPEWCAERLRLACSCALHTTRATRPHWTTSTKTGTRRSGMARSMGAVMQLHCTELRTCATLSKAQAQGPAGC